MGAQISAKIDISWFVELPNETRRPVDRSGEADAIGWINSDVTGAQPVAGKQR